jgi:serine/threonine protein phosphatase 1
MSMLAALRSLFKAPPAPVYSPSRITQLTYAIGDIHGRFDLLEAMIRRIRADKPTFDEKPRIVLLGDYVDRGPQSREVLTRIVRLTREAWCDVEVLLGNHEESMLKFLSDASTGPSWVHYGGGATLASYGVSVPDSRADMEQWERARLDFAAALPDNHLVLLREMKYVLQADDYIFVHAGVRPDRPLAEQGPDTFLWVRGAFLASEKACEFVVVHGHTPEDAPTDKRWRIGIDTGAYATGVLTAMRLKDEARDLIQVRQQDVGVQ